MARFSDEPFVTAVHEQTRRETTCLTVLDFSLWYGTRQALHRIGLEIPKGRITALIGPSGCGKTSLLRSLNRLNDLVEGVRIEGEILLGHDPVYHPRADVLALRRRMGMVFQNSNPFPMSIRDNVAFPLRIDGIRSRSFLEERVETSLRQAGLWEEVKDRLREPGTGLSEGQRQRLCIARALSARPEVLLMDEPCSALDPLATGRVEDLILSLAGTYTIAIVTHNMQQAARVSHYTSFLDRGCLVEFGPTERVFQRPLRTRTEDYISGRFG